MGHLAGTSQGVLDVNPATAPGGGIRRVDPRTRILAVVLFAVIVVALDNPAALVLALAASVLMMVSARLPAGRTLRRMAAMDGFIVFMLLMLPFTVPGDAIFHIWKLTASWQGALMALKIALKANAVVLAMLALVGSLDSVRFGHALHRLRVPENLVHLLMFTVRYIEVLHQEYLRLRTAMKARGFEAHNSMHTYRTFGYLIGMMLVRALERSERILEAMKCRGFSGRLPVLEDLRFGPNDLFFGGLFLAAIALLINTELLYVIAL